MSVYSIISWCIALAAILGSVGWMVVKRLRSHQQLVTERRGNERRADERRASDRQPTANSDEQNPERRNLERRESSERRDRKNWQEEYFQLKEEVEFYSDGMDETADES